MSYENFDPQEDILVQCRNKDCDWKGKPKWFPPSLVMFDGEPVVCGGCGQETEFIGPNRPARKPKQDG